MSSNPDCIVCQGDTNKFGKTKKGVQRYRCKDKGCKKIFNDSHLKPAEPLETPTPQAPSLEVEAPQAPHPLEPTEVVVDEPLPEVELGDPLDIPTVNLGESVAIEIEPPTVIPPIQEEPQLRPMTRRKAGVGLKNR